MSHPLSPTGVVMFGGDHLSSYVPDVGVQESMNEHGDAPLWKIKYVMKCLAWDNSQIIETHLMNLKLKIADRTRSKNFIAF